MQRTHLLSTFPTRRSWLVWLLASLLLAWGASAQAQTGAADIDPDAGTDKYNAYVKAFNAVNDMFYGGTKGMPDLLDKYRSQNLGNRSSGSGREPIRYMNVSMLRNSVDALRSGVNDPEVGPYAKLDAVAKAMFGNADPLLRLSREMEDYFSSKKYTDDDFARGREMDAPYVAGWKQFIEDHARLGEALSEAERLGRMAEIAAARRKGKHLLAATLDVMLSSSDLIDLFNEASDLRDKAKTAQADPLAAQIEKDVAEIRQLTQSGDRSVYLNTLIADNMSQLLGHYRALKSAFFPSKSDFEGLVDKYNRSVRHLDRINR